MPRLWILLGLVAAGTWWWLSRRRPRDSGDGDVLPGPSRPRRSNDPFAPSPESIAQAKNWTDKEIALEVENFLLQRTHNEDHLQQQLAQQPENTVKHTLQMLEHPDFRVRMRRRKNGTTGLVRAMHLFALHPSTAIVEHVREMLDDPDDEVVPTNARRNAVRLLAHAGATADIAALLQGNNLDLRTAALWSLLDAHRKGAIDESAGDELTPALLECLDKPGCERAVSVLLLFDRVGAIEELQARNMLHPQHDAFADVLEAMSAADAPLSRDHLLSQWHEQTSPAPSYAARRAMLRMLGRHGDARDDALFDELMNSTDACAGDAAEVVASRRGFPDWRDRLHQRRFHLDVRLTDSERVLAAMADFDMEVNNGGLNQYFRNSAGNGHRRALAGFDETGDEDRKQILRDAMRKFPSIVSVDRDERHAALDELADNTFDRLDERFYALTSSSEVTLTRYLLAHAEELRFAWGL